MNGELVVEAKGVGKRYPLHGTGRRALVDKLRGTVNETWAVRGVSFEVRRGEVVGVMGRNGSGKSTLLGLACGTLQPTEGRIDVRGRVAALLELGAGFHPEFSGRENVRMNGRLLGISTAEMDSRMEVIAAFADIGEALERPVKTYSTGMHLRLAFAVAAHVEAELLVIDEALAVGDALFVQKCMRFLREFRERGAILFVSHDPAAVLSLCTRALWLEGGALRMAGEPKAVCEAYHAFLASGDATAQAGEFGEGAARIVAVTLRDAGGRPLAGVRGGEAVVLEVIVEARDTLVEAVVGFYVKDRRGQQLFGENVEVAGVRGRLAVRFAFEMPRLGPGAYTVDAAVAEGTRGEHVIAHWLHDVAAFESVNGETHRGLVGIAVRVEVEGGG